MRKFIRKMIALLICISITSTCTAFIYANNDSQENYPVSLISREGIDSENLIPISVNYEHNINNNAENGFSSAEVDVTLFYETFSSNFIAHGDIQVFTLSNGFKYMYGALDGTCLINDSEYDVIVGLQKFSHLPEASLTLTISDSDTNVIIKFGNLSVPYAIVNEVFSDSTNTLDSTSVVNGNQIEPQEMSQGNYQYQTSSVGKFDGVNAVKQSIYYYNTKRRISVLVTPYLQNLCTYNATTGITRQASVDRITIQVTEASGSETFIDGLVSAGSSSINDSGVDVIGAPARNVIAAFASLFWSATGPYLTLFNALLDAITYPSAEITPTADALTAVYDNLNLYDEDWDEYGLSVAFQLDTFDGQNTNPSAKYIYSSEIRYHIKEVDSLGNLTIFYEDVETNKTVTTNFS